MSNALLGELQDVAPQESPAIVTLPPEPVSVAQALARGFLSKMEAVQRSEKPSETQPIQDPNGPKAGWGNFPAVRQLGSCPLGGG